MRPHLQVTWSLPLTLADDTFLPSVRLVPHPTQVPLDSSQAWTGAIMFLNIELL